MTAVDDPHTKPRDHDDDHDHGEWRPGIRTAGSVITPGRSRRESHPVITDTSVRIPQCELP